MDPKERKQDNKEKQKNPIDINKDIIQSKIRSQTKKQQTKIAQTKIWKNVRMLWDGNQIKSRTKAVAA